MQTILEFLNGQMNKPELFGSFQASWFQYLSLLLVIIGIIFAISRMKGLHDRKLNHVLWIFSGLLLGFEIYKQVIFTYQAQGSYQWYAFPFQFCSTPMYVALVAGFLKPGKIKHALMSFLGTFGLFAGLAVVIYPATVFVTTTGINIQTMVHHGSMAILGFGLLAHYVELKWKSLLHASFVFLALMVIAMTMNQIHNHWIQQGTFNMFFINPLYENGIPVLMIFQPLVPHHVFLLIYLFGFTLVAGIVFGFRLLFAKLQFSKDPLYQNA
ncbi:MAG TPA: YwaF family protein [Acholeplasmataceae bacterium]|nr:YwaF family protein [Acholeplasmataceae bacterium]